MHRQEFYRSKYKEKNPTWENSLTLYHDLIKSELKNGKLLDIGCGHADFMRDIYLGNSNVYGIDPDPQAIQKNQIIKNKLVGFSEKLPFENDNFDLVVSAWVLEHLSDPLASFKEVSRILKKGGKFIFLTPNSKNFVSIINKVVPNNLHEFFTTRLYGRKESDTYPVQYKANSEKILIELAKQTGFSKWNFIYNEDPSYISFDKISFEISLLLEKLFAQGNKKVHLIGTLEK